MWIFWNFVRSEIANGYKMSKQLKKMYMNTYRLSLHDVHNVVSGQYLDMFWSRCRKIIIFTHLKLCLADAIHNFKWVKIVFINLNSTGMRPGDWLILTFMVNRCGPWLVTTYRSKTSTIGSIISMTKLDAGNCVSYSNFTYRWNSTLKALKYLYILNQENFQFEIIINDLVDYFRFFEYLCYRSTAIINMLLFQYGDRL